MNKYFLSKKFDVPFNHAFINQLKCNCRADHSFCVLAAASKQLQIFNDVVTRKKRRQYIRSEAYLHHCKSYSLNCSIAHKIMKHFWFTLPSSHMQQFPYTRMIRSINFIEGLTPVGMNDSYVICKLLRFSVGNETCQIFFETKNFQSKILFFKKHTDNTRTAMNPQDIRNRVLYLIKKNMERILQIHSIAEPQGSPLQYPWQAFWDENSGYYYYFNNPVTGQIQWEFPTT